MTRDIQRLSNETFDILIVGGGIYGACIAWDAALRGLKVALVEKRDFGHATSANSMKVIHGGLRHLQTGSLAVVKTLNRERAIFMQIAPHLVHPLPFVMATRGRSLRSRPAFNLAFSLSNALGGVVRNDGDPARALPPARTIGSAELAEIAPGLATDSATGGAIWYDAQMYNSERLTLAFILSAAQQGAAVANYVEATAIRRVGARVLGAHLADVLSGSELEVNARIVVLAVGASDSLRLENAGLAPPVRRDQLALAVNLVTRQITADRAIGFDLIESDSNGAARADKAAFIVPWRGRSLVGTFLLPVRELTAENGRVEEKVDRILSTVNRAYPQAELRREDVHQIHRGLVPVVGNEQTGLRLLRSSRIVDHKRTDAIDGLISVVGVKYSSARLVAEQVVDLVFGKLDALPPQCRTREQPLAGGEIPRMDRFLSEAVESKPQALAGAAVEGIARSYGSEYPALYAEIRKDPAAAVPVLGQERVARAQVSHAVRHEMAIRLSDVVMRRTELGALGDTGPATLRDCARIMAGELGWSKDRLNAELEEVRAGLHLDGKLRVLQD